MLVLMQSLLLIGVCLAFPSVAFVPRPARHSASLLHVATTSDNALAAVSDTTSKSSISIRRATPEEMDNLSILVANSFTNSSGDSLVDRIRSKATHFTTRWIVYAGMLGRFVMASYQEGYEEASSRNQEKIISSSNTRHHLFVAEIERTSDRDKNNTVIGVVELVHESPCPIPFGEENRKAPMICNLAVLPPFQKLGAGRALLQHAIMIASESRTEVWLETEYTNIPALQMYLSEGFVCEGVDPEIRGNRRQAYLRMRLGKSAPPYSNQVLSFISGEAHYNVTTSAVGELSVLEKNFGVLAPLVAVLGTFVGIFLF